MDAPHTLQTASAYRLNASSVSGKVAPRRLPSALIPRKRVIGNGVMFDKAEYYHGAALVRVLEHAECRKIRKLGVLGYILNDEYFIFLKYTTKVRSPWGFTFDKEDVDRCTRMASSYRRVTLGLVCGSDGVCGLRWEEATRLLDGRPGRIAVGRKHNRSYSVWGSAATLKSKVPLNRWPAYLFESEGQ